MRTSTGKSSHPDAGRAPVWSPTLRRGRPRRAPDRAATPTDSIEDLGLAVGEPVRLFPAGNQDFAFEVRLVGWIGRQSVLVTQPSWAGRPMAMQPGESCRVRLFHGRRAISFTTTVLGIHDVPTPCLALAYPEEIYICEVRSEDRVTIEIGAKVGDEGGLQCLPCRLRDLSLSGLCIHAASPIAPPGSRIVVRFAIEISGRRHPLALAGEVRNLSENRGEETGWLHGIELDPIEAEDRQRLADFLRQGR